MAGQAQFDYPDTDEVRILCDGGGSNNSSANMTILFDEMLPKWNFTAIPQTN